MAVELGYLFTAVYKDGTFYTQHPLDISGTSPPDSNGNGKSSFYDVSQRMDDLATFWLSSLKDHHIIAVDMLTGEFFENGILLNIDINRDMLAYPRKLIYGRNWESRYTRDEHGNATTDNKLVSYVIGWECVTPDGVEVQYTVNILV